MYFSNLDIVKPRKGWEQLTIQIFEIICIRLFGQLKDLYVCSCTRLDNYTSWYCYS